MHPYWKIPIKRLEESYKKLLQFTTHINNLLEKSSKAQLDIVSEELFDITIEAVENRCKLRKAWEQRLKDGIFKTLEVEARPFQSPEFKAKLDIIRPELIRKWKSAFIHVKQGNVSDKSGSKRKRKDKNGTLTKKERKRVASNWEKMKMNKL